MDIIPVTLVEASEWGEDEDGLLVCNRVGRVGDIIEMVVNNRRWSSLAFIGILR